MTMSRYESELCPVLRPTRREFSRPFIDFVSDVFARNPGLPAFKVVPPAGWRARASPFPDLMDIEIGTPIRQHVFGSKGSYRCAPLVGRLGQGRGRGMTGRWWGITAPGMPPGLQQAGQDARLRSPSGHLRLPHPLRDQCMQPSRANAEGVPSTRPPSRAILVEQKNVSADEFKRMAEAEMKGMPAMQRKVSEGFRE